MRNLILTTLCVLALSATSAQQNDLASLDENMIGFKSIEENNVKTKK